MLEFSVKVSIKSNFVSIITANQKLPYYPPICDSFTGEKIFFKIGDTNLYVEKLGTGIPILFVHGGPGSSHHYFHNTFKKPIKGIQIIFYDQRGCFKSSYSKNHKYTIEEAVEDIEGLRKKLGIEKWYVLGHSYGGLLAQIYKRDYPNSLLGVILVCSAHGLLKSGISKTSDKYLSNEELKRIKEIENDSSLSLQENIYNSFLNGEWKRQNYYKPTRKEMYFSSTYEWEHDIGFNEGMSDDMQNYNLEGCFKNSEIKTLIIEGNDDPTWDKSKTRLLVKNHPGCEVTTFPNSSHEPFKDRKEDFINRLRNFVTLT